MNLLLLVIILLLLEVEIIVHLLFRIFTDYGKRFYISFYCCFGVNLTALFIAHC